MSNEMRVLTWSLFSKVCYGDVQTVVLCSLRTDIHLFRLLFTTISIKSHGSGEMDGVWPVVVPEVCCKAFTRVGPAVNFALSRVPCSLLALRSLLRRHMIILGALDDWSATQRRMM